MNIICKQQYVREDNEKNMLKNKMTIEHMNLHYGDFHALKDINLNIKENQITAFIGPSGCGKSTLLKSLNRMNDLVEGCKIDGLIALDGEDIYGNNMDVNLLRKRVGMVFQKANPFPMSIYDNVAFGPRTHGIHNKAQLDEIVEKSLRDAAIWDEVKDRLKKQLAGGLPVDVFLLDVVVSVAADEIQTEDHGVEGQGNAGRGRDGVDFAGIEKQDIAGRNRECPAVDVGSSVSFREKKQLIFFVPVGSHALRTGRV